MWVSGGGGGEVDQGAGVRDSRREGPCAHDSPLSTGAMRGLAPTYAVEALEALDTVDAHWPLSGAVEQSGPCRGAPIK